jgi:cysteinyl-tRNA synthetase
MSKSLGNSFLPSELIAGSHPLLEQAYSPMTVRFFMLQSQYRSTLDFSNDALKAAQKGYKRLANGLKIIRKMEFVPDEAVAFDDKHLNEINQAIQGFYDGMNDDLNTAIGIAQLFNLLKKINQLYTGQLSLAILGKEGFEKLKSNYITLMEDVLGLKEEKPADWEALSKGLLSLYKDFKFHKNYEKVDEIRTYFKEMGLLVKDLKNTTDWGYEE